MNYTIFASRTFWTAAFLTVYNVSAALGTIYPAPWLTSLVDILGLIWTIQERGAPLSFWALENPQGYLYNFLGQPAFWFQPWMFGDTSFTATKRTALWGYFNSPVRTVRKRRIPFVSPRSSKRDFVNPLRENYGWYNATAEERAMTPEGFARAFFKANQ
jgi:hypothetical protein